MGQEALLTSTRAHPVKLQQAGYQFKHPEIQEALQAVVFEGQVRI
jgi:NAD dependent epimerase/dehydratase family enzyme